MVSTNPQQLLTLLQNAKGQPAESLVRDHVQTLMAHRADLQKAHQMLQQAKTPSVTPAARTLVGEHANTLLKNSSESHMLTQMQKLAKLLKLAKMSPIQQHAVSDAYKAHMAAPTAPAARPMVRDPHAFAAHQSVMQNPGAYAPQGQVSSGLELATPPRAYKRASELEKLSAMLKDNKSWMPEGKEKKDTGGMAGNEGCSKTSEVQKLAALLQKHAGFMQQGMRQLNTAVNNPGMISRGAGKLYNAAGGGLGGVGAVAKHYAPGAAMLAAPVAAGALGMGLMGGGQQPQDQTRMASEKRALDADWVPAMGGVDPRMAALAGGLAAPEGHRIPGAIGAGISSYGGQALGSGLGELTGAGLAALLKQDPELLRYVGGRIGRFAGGYGTTQMAMPHVMGTADKKTEKPTDKKTEKPTEKQSSFGPEMRKLSGMMSTVGRGLGMAGKAVGIVPGVGTAIGAGLGGIGGAMAAPPGKRMAGAALGAVTGAMGPIAGTAVNMAGSRMLGV